MSEPENATKAPESDANEPSTTESSAPADHVVGEHCVTDRPIPAGQSSTGEIIKLNEIDTYISKPADYPHAPARLLLLLTGGTGIKSVNNQIQADKFASEGFLVLMPDMFGGDTTPGTAITDNSTSILEQVKLKAVEMAKSFVIDMWLARVTPDKVMPILHRVIEAARDQYAEAGSLKSGPYIRAGAVAHAASVIPDDFKDIKAPLSFACVEDDPLFSDTLRSEGEDLMTDAGLEHEVQVYPRVPHGFAVVGEYPDQTIKDAQATAYEQMLKWLQGH